MPNPDRAGRARKVFRAFACLVLTGSIVVQALGCLNPLAPRPLGKPLRVRNVSSAEVESTPRGWRFYNAGTTTIKRVFLRVGEGHGGAVGAIGPGRALSMKQGYDPRLSIAGIDWLDSSRFYHHQNVEFVGLVPAGSGFVGDIWFVFDGAGWYLRPMSEAHTLALTAKRLPIVPQTALPH